MPGGRGSPFGKASVLNSIAFAETLPSVSFRANSLLQDANLCQTDGTSIPEVQMEKHTK